MSDRQSVVPQPNFLGGFLCGFLGVLAFAWLGEIAMWIAGTLGFVIGCWPREIFASIAAACRVCVNQVPCVGVGLFKSERSPIIRAARYVFGSKYRRLYCLRVVIVLLLSLPWFVCALTILWILPQVGPISSPVRGIVTALVLTVMIISSASCVIFPIMIMLTADLPHMTRQQSWAYYYRSLRQRRERHGLLFCLGYDIYNTIKRQLAVMSMFVFGICAGLLLLAVVATVAPFVLAVRGLLLLNSRAGGIVCLAVALAVTACSAWTLTDYLAGTLLWVIALATGCVAGSATVVTQKLVTSTMPRASDRVRAFAEQAIASRVKPLAVLLLAPEHILFTVVCASPEKA